MTTERSQEHIKEYLHASEQTLEEAQVLLERGLLKGAANRAYYAMFYAVRAALTFVNVKMPKTHSGGISLFGQHYVKTGKVDKRLANDLREAFEVRQRSDYEIEAQVGTDEVKERVERAEAFVAEVKKVIGVQ